MSSYGDHQQSGTALQEQRDDPNVATVAYVGLVGIILLFALIVALQAMYYNFEQAELTVKTQNPMPVVLSDLRAEQQQALADYHWVDREKGVVGLPIEEAMQRVADGAEPKRPEAVPTQTQTADQKMQETSD